MQQLFGTGEWRLDLASFLWGDPQPADVGTKPLNSSPPMSRREGTWVNTLIAQESEKEKEKEREKEKHRTLSIRRWKDRHSHTTHAKKGHSIKDWLHTSRSFSEEDKREFTAQYFDAAEAGETAKMLDLLKMGESFDLSVNVRKPANSDELDRPKGPSGATTPTTLLSPRNHNSGEPHHTTSGDNSPTNSQPQSSAPPIVSPPSESWGDMGPTALFLAALHGHVEPIKYLAAKGADVNVRVRWNPEGGAPHFEGAATGLKDKKSAEEPNEDCMTPLSAAVGQGHLQTVKALLSLGANPKATVNTATPLFIACRHGHMEIAKVLIEAAPGLVEKSHKDGRTPLFIAAMGGHRDVVELCMNHGGDPTILTDGLTPLFISCYRGYPSVVELLLTSPRVDVNFKTPDGATPLFMASHGGHKELVSLLLRKGALADAKHDDGRTPLFVACQFGHIDVVRLLLQAGADVNVAVDEDGMLTPLYMASMEAHNELVSLLISTGKCSDESVAAQFEAEGAEKPEGEKEAEEDKAVNIGAPTDFKRLSMSTVQMQQKDQVSHLMQEVEQTRRRRIIELMKGDMRFEFLMQKALLSSNTPAQVEFCMMLFKRYKNIYQPIFENDASKANMVSAETAQLDADFAEDEGVKKSYNKSQEVRLKLRPLNEIRALLIREERPVLGTGMMAPVTFESKSTQELINLFGSLENAHFYNFLVENGQRSDRGRIELKMELDKVDKRIAELGKQQQQIVDIGAFFEEVLKRASNALRMESMVMRLGKMAAAQRAELEEDAKKSLEEDTAGALLQSQQAAQAAEKEAAGGDAGSKGGAWMDANKQRAMVRMMIRGSVQISNGRDLAMLNEMETHAGED
eukprot:TRINITY_DN528_c0_g1_i1.p1 TRINITY_DN528_c0_g1~~TRINITY_DN528_c0_g1_i1.p1  ORF type:complete len:857 (+),score=168.20 TRINITY_DN528_c0_g1_i1:241-2811(+)